MAYISLLPLIVMAILLQPFGNAENSQPPQVSPTLSLQDVVKRTQSGISEELIITMIKKNAKAFDLNTEELLELKSAGVSDEVIKYLYDPSLPYTPPAPAAPSPGENRSGPRTVKTFPEDAFASKVPPEPGLYSIVNNALLRVETRNLLGKIQGAGIGKFIMRKGKVVGYLVGPASKTRLQEVAPRFYIRLPEDKGIEQLVLIALERDGDSRVVELGATADKLELKAEVMRQFDSLEVGPRVFRITPNKLAQGEYLFFLVGSAEPPKGNYGKGYDFGIDVKTK